MSRQLWKHVVEGKLITKVDHIGIVVRNLDEAVSIFCDRFGFKAGELRSRPGMPFKSIIVSSGEVNLELVEPTTPEGDAARLLKEKGGGISHVSFATDDIEQELSSLKANGVSLVHEKPLSLPNTRIAFVKAESAQNVSIELVQRG
jgi:methylmalonyl-CoA/ethylmalonyl-CoA epimerase